MASALESDVSSEEQQEDESSDKFFSLPREMKLRIFSHLTPDQLLHTAALVCKSWRELSEDADLWQEVKMDGSKITVRRAMNVFSKMSQVRSLRLRSMSAGADVALDAVGVCVETLELYDVNIEHTDTLESLVRRCTKLREVTLKSCNVPEENAHLLDVFSGTKIETMRLNRINSALPIDETLKRSYPNLLNVHIHQATCIPGMQALLGSMGGQLRKLSTSVVQQPEILSSLAQCLQLEELTLTVVPAMTDGALLNKVVSQLRSLRCLAITCANSLTTLALRSFLSLPVVGKLERLNLFNSHYLDKTCLHAIATNCKSLTHLDLSCCPNITLEALLEIIRNCHRLSHLDAIRCPGLELTPDDLAAIAKIQPGLVIRCPRKRVRTEDY